MPTVIVLDVSLSMCKTVKNLGTKDANSSGDSFEVKQLANVGIGVMLDYFAQNAQLEHTALVVFSSLWELKCPFTRHHESIKNGIYDLELYDKSNVVNAIRGLSSLKLQDWSQNGPVNIILITDGQLYHESMSNQTGEADNTSTSRLQDDSNDALLTELEGLFNFPCKIQVVCLTSPRDFALKYSVPFYKSLVSSIDSSTTDCPVMIGTSSKNFKKSAIWLPESDSLDISVESVEELFAKIVEHHYKPYHTTLSCGHLSSMVMLSPKPTECLLEPLKNEFDDLKNEQSLKEDAKETFVSAINKSRLYKLSEEINICGFMPLAEVASPAVVSRHFVLPIVNNKFNETFKTEQILSQDPNAYNKSIQAINEGLEMATTDNQTRTSATDQKLGKGATSTTELATADQDVTKQPSFCVLLHNALKQENMVAICMVGKNEETNDDWFGMLHAHIDSKKRSSLMLSLLIPDSNPILWLPSFRTMGSSMLNSDLPQAIREKLVQSRGPLKSYSSNNVIWLDPESVQADVQKIVRHAKRSPDKVPHFYKELNRIRRAAISYGFYDVLFGLADILEREKRVMMIDQNKNVNQEMLDHIDHVVASLRSSLDEGSYDTNISPKA